MRLLATVLISLLGIIDAFIFLILLVQPQFIKEVLLIHIALYLVMKWVDSSFLKKSSGIPNYLAFFLPGLGSLIVAFLHFSLYYFKRDGLVLGEYEQYINFEQFFEHTVKPDYNDEMRTLSFLDQINLLDSADKKKLIIELATNHYAAKVKLLHEALLDDDQEVQHYSAVSLNILENEYNQLISQLRQRFTQNKDSDSLIKLTKVYQSYLQSGLISGEVFQEFNKEYLEVLKKLVERKKESEVILCELVKAYINSGNYEQAKVINGRLLELYPKGFEGVLHQVHIAYEKKAYKDITQLLNQIKEEKADFFIKNKKMTSFWTDKEEAS